MVDMQVIIDGTLLGGLYATVALGLSLVFGVMRLVNLAHGELLIGGAFLSYPLVTDVGVDPLLSLAVVVPIAFAFAYALQRLLLTGLLHRGMEPPLVATFGVTLLLQTGFVAIFTGNTKSLPAPYADAGVEILGVNVRIIYLIAFAIGVVLAGAAQLALTRTSGGVALRAASVDAETARTMGIDVERVYAVTLGISAAMAAVAGVLAGLAFSFTPTSGGTYLIIGFAVAVLGGAGSMLGALVGGVLLGVIESSAGALLGGSYRELVVYLLLLLLIAVRPRGLLNTGAAV